MNWIKEIAKIVLKEEIKILESQIPKKNFYQEYYNNKYPKTDIFYKRTDKLGTINIDVRQFLNFNNCLFPKINGENDSEKAINSLIWVIDNIKYIPDKTEYGLEEYWAYGYETFNYKKGDCEDGAILLYDIMRANGIPAWKLRINAGLVNNPLNQKVGHCFVVYYNEETNKWQLLDWCYYPSKLGLEFRDEYKNEANYITTWFSFNENFSYNKDIKDIPKMENITN